jgi:methionyl aminopeptidase
VTYECDVDRHRPGQARRASGDIGAAIQKHAEGAVYSVVREFCGHGIGRNFHEEPQVLHYGKGSTLDELQARHGVHHRADDQRRQSRIKELPDGWTIVTKDRSLSAQWEHTVWSPKPASRC